VDPSLGNVFISLKCNIREKEEILIAYKIPLARFLRGNHRLLKLHRREKTNSETSKQVQ